jgi:hypothetical protein
MSGDKSTAWKRPFALVGVQDGEKQDAQHLAEDFAESIMISVEDIPNSDGMRVLKEVVNLETGDHLDAVIRKITQPLWQDCIDKVNTERCAIVSVLLEHLASATQ